MIKVKIILQWRNRMGKTVLITGAASGIGRAFADIFAKEQYNMVIVGRNLEKMEAMQQGYESTYHIRVYPLRADLSKDGEAARVYEKTKDLGLDIDVLINNAGVGDYGRFVDIPWEKERALAGLNMLSVMQLMQLFAADMERRGSGKILNMASIAAYTPGPYMPMYYASKSFVYSLSQAVSKEMEGTGVTITCLCPGPTATNFEKEAQMGSGNLMFKRFRPLTAAEVAQEGYSALMKGSAVRTTKGRYRFFKLLCRFGPEQVKRDLTARVNLGSR